LRASRAWLSITTENIPLSNIFRFNAEKWFAFALSMVMAMEIVVVINVFILIGFNGSEQIRAPLIFPFEFAENNFCG